MDDISLSNLIAFMQISPIFLCTTNKLISNYLF